jgi:hypothetical protein
MSRLSRVRPITSQFGLRGALLALCLAWALTALIAAAPTTHAAGTISPKIAECSTWVTVQTTNVSHTYGAVTYTGYVRLQKLNDFGTYCGVLRAVASITTPTGALTAQVRGVLYYQPFNTTTKSTLYGSWLSATSGHTATSITGSRGAQYGQAIGDFIFPDGSRTYSTSWLKMK